MSEEHNTGWSTLYDVDQSWQTLFFVEVMTQLSWSDLFYRLTFLHIAFYLRIQLFKKKKKLQQKTMKVMFASNY